MIILGIETSCDETAASIVEAQGEIGSPEFRALGSAVWSQIEEHKAYGGVVPNIAKREHQKHLPQVLQEAISKSGLSKENIDIIAVTVGPGLEPALWTGIEFAKKLGEEWNLPVIPANHMEGHIASVLFNKTDEFSISNSQFSNAKLSFPVLALLISGGHTELVLLKSWVEKEKIGQTQDDAVGEAFDKVARMMGLPYPGGPEISRLARQAREQGIELEKKLPRPMMHSKDLNFSFSGLKTAVLYYIKNHKENNFLDDETGKMAVAREFEDAVIETLVFKTERAIEEYAPKTLVIGGGVIANKALRENFLNLKRQYPDLEILIPEKNLTTDNATMIAAAGYIEYLRHGGIGQGLKADGNLDIELS